MSCLPHCPTGNHQTTIKNWLERTQLFPGSSSPSFPLAPAYPVMLIWFACSATLWCSAGLLPFVSPEEPEHFLIAPWLQVTKVETRMQDPTIKRKTTAPIHQWALSVVSALPFNLLCDLGQVIWPPPAIVLSFVRGGDRVRKLKVLPSSNITDSKSWCEIFTSIF